MSEHTNTKEAGNDMMVVTIIVAEGSNFGNNLCAIIFSVGMQFLDKPEDYLFNVNLLKISRNSSQSSGNMDGMNRSCMGVKLGRNKQCK